MDRTTRWETEAIRAASRIKSQPPRPSGKRAASPTNWVTLREAEAATSVPVNTLRKWVRKADLPSYLESDGDIALRMVDLDAVIARAGELGRTVEPHSSSPDPRADGTSHDIEGADDEDTREPEPVPSPEPSTPEGTMIVPIDAWNKMLNQLGNLHEAGQQLAQARERAAKAETEATFLRERLAEMRTAAASLDEEVEKVITIETVPIDSPEDDTEATEDLDSAIQPETTTYWRYLTTGWRERRRRRSTRD
jgi:hypothetical protein